MITYLQIRAVGYPPLPPLVDLLLWDQWGIHIHHSLFDRRRDFAEVKVNIAEKYRKG